MDGVRFCNEFPMAEVTENSTVEEIYESMGYASLPEHMKKGMAHWIKYGQEPGHFLQALLKNDFCETICRADSINFINLWSWCMWLQGCVPSQCFGSVEKYNAWRDKDR